MCRSTEFPHFRPSPAAGRLDLKAFYVRFSGPRRTPEPEPEPEPEPGPFPDSLTLVYLPSIAGHALEIDGSKVRPDHPAFLTLHRVVTARARRGGGDVVYGSRDRVRAGPGLRFEVYLGEEKALRGSFRRDQGQEWRLECACALEREVLAGADAGARWVSEVCVAAEGHVAMSERVEMVARKRSRKSSRVFHGLEEIPEEREESDSESDGGCCCCCGGERECGSDGRDDEEEEEEEGADGEDWEVNTEGVRWAVDVGIWVACLGVGYLVSKASARSLRRRRLL